jgi:hypothetical protein
MKQDGKRHNRVMEERKEQDIKNRMKAGDNLPIKCNKRKNLVEIV